MWLLRSAVYVESSLRSFEIPFAGTDIHRFRIFRRCISIYAAFADLAFCHGSNNEDFRRLRANRRTPFRVFLN